MSNAILYLKFLDVIKCFFGFPYEANDFISSTALHMHWVETAYNTTGNKPSILSISRLFDVFTPLSNRRSAVQF